MRGAGALGGAMHIGIGAAILILGIIYFAIVSPGFRIFLFSVMGLMGVALLILISRK
jgi:acetyl-CoA carboxylase alpha subunit